MPVSGAVQDFYWDLSAGSTWKAAGLIAGGQVGADQTTQIRYGAGNRASYLHGRLNFPASIQVEATADTVALVACALRGAGALAAVKYVGGTNAVNFAHTGAYLNTLRARGATDEPLTCDLGFLALAETETAAAVVPVDPTSDLLAWYGADLTVDGSNYLCQGFEISVDNGCQYYGSLDAKVATTVRLPEGIVVGAEKVTVNADFLTQQTWDVDDDAPGTSIALVASYSLGADSITFTFTDLTRTGPRAMPFERESGLVVWRYSFVGHSGCLAIT
jgi:hypothetical protein